MPAPTAALDKESSAETPPEAAPRRKLVVPLIIGAAIVVGGSVGALVLGPRVARARSLARDSTSAGVRTEKAAADHGAAPADAPVHMIENLVLNPAGSGGARFLLASVGLQTTSAVANELVIKRDVEARDVVLAILGGKRVEELAEISNRDRFRVELKNALDSLLGPGVVRRIYFPQFVIQ
jgi:flagellar FliL protein